MSAPQIEVEPVEQTYDEKLLTIVEQLPEGGVPLGWVRSIDEDPRLWRYEDTTPTQATDVQVVEEGVTELRESVALRGLSVEVPGVPRRSFRWVGRGGRIRDQGFTPRCVCYSGAVVRIFQERREHRRTYEVNEGAWYDATKKIDPWGPSVEGTGIPYAAEIARTQGVRMEDPRSTRDDPEQGRLFRIGAYTALTTVPQMIECLANYGPVWFGTDVDRNIFTPRKSDLGYVLPEPGQAKMAGGHAMALLGYDLDLGWGLVQQSWGEDYGGHPRYGPGLFWYPLSYFADARYEWDAWLVSDEHDDFIVRPGAG